MNIVLIYTGLIYDENTQKKLTLSLSSLSGKHGHETSFPKKIIVQPSKIQNTNDKSQGLIDSSKPETHSAKMEHFTSYEVEKTYIKSKRKIYWENMRYT